MAGQAASDRDEIRVWGGPAGEWSGLEWDVGASRLDFHDRLALGAAVGALYEARSSGGFGSMVSAEVRYGRFARGRLDDRDPFMDPPVRFLADAGSGELRAGKVGLHVFHRGGSPILHRMTYGLGWRWMTRDVRIRHGVQVEPDRRRLEGLDSRYSSSWAGMWFSGGPRFGLRGTVAEVAVSYHRPDFTAVGDWNLRDDLAHPRSFTQEASGDGWGISLEIRRSFSDRAALVVRAERLELSAENGLDRVYRADGEVSRSHLDFVDLEWTEVQMSMDIRF